MNKMDQVWKMLGVDIFTRFHVAPAPYKDPVFMHKEVAAGPYYFTDEGLTNRYATAPECNALVLQCLITGELTIQVLPEDQQ